MSETHKTDKTAPKIDQATAFTTWQNLYRAEAGKLLDEGSAAMERAYAESERMLTEGNRLFAAQGRAMQEASRAVFTGLRAMIG